MAKGKKGRSGDDGPAEKPALVAHPRARRSIRRWRGRAGLIGLVLGAWLSLRAGVPAFDAVARGLAAGIAGQFVAWGAAVMIWRQLVIGELIAFRDARAEAASARAEAAASGS
jgi:hypothetical protein